MFKNALLCNGSLPEFNHFFFGPQPSPPNFIKIWQVFEISCKWINKQTMQGMIWRRSSVFSGMFSGGKSSWKPNMNIQNECVYNPGCLPFSLSSLKSVTSHTPFPFLFLCHLLFPLPSALLPSVPFWTFLITNQDLKHFLHFSSPKLKSFQLHCYLSMYFLFSSPVASFAAFYPSDKVSQRLHPTV